MGLFNPAIHIHLHLPAGNSDLAQLKQFMAENFEQLTAKIAALEAPVATIVTGVQTANTSLVGVVDDLAYLKEQLANNPTPEQIAAAVTLVDNLTAKVTPAADAISALATAVADLDAQTQRP